MWKYLRWFPIILFLGVFTAKAEMPGNTHLISYLGKNRVFDVFLSETHGHMSAKCKYTWLRGEELWVERDGIIEGLVTDPGHIRIYGDVEDCPSHLENLRQWFLDQDYPFHKSVQINKTPEGRLNLEYLENSPEEALQVFLHQQEKIRESLNSN